MSANRYNDGKPKWSLVDFESLIPLVRGLEYGAKKYSKDQWKLGLSVTECVESALRHIFSFLDGEDIDSESGQSHIGHVMCNLMFISYMLRNKQEYDDRNK